MGSRSHSKEDPQYFPAWLQVDSVTVQASALWYSGEVLRGRYLFSYCPGQLANLDVLRLKIVLVYLNPLTSSLKFPLNIEESPSEAGCFF
ncbi:hypothetical protein AVEN_197208-1 [Araneus ventricosus]|uniref:Uncharacterized protein n=1 Tax=Araneus ventricosus TaxID=182803 RepID=A0A4Y2GGC9_ARAVE|nr:hypothetical protein AVEN_197208-1 [Araneus ventricosus]